MKNEPPADEGLLELISRSLDGAATAEERRRLNEQLRGNPELCEAYLDWATTHALMSYGNAGRPGLEDLPGIVEFPTRAPAARRAPPRLWLGLAAALVFGLLLNAGLLWQRAEAPAPEHQQQNGVAVLSREIKPVWAAGSPSRSEGMTLEPGPLKLESGFVQLEFFSGATLIVEGPSELELVDAFRVVCRSGRIRASVPEPAQGFTVVAPDFQAVDLGTEFALSVGADGQSEVHVVEGEVRLEDPAGREERLLLTGNSLRKAPGTGDDWLPIPLQGGAFVNQEEMLRLAGESWRQRYADWQRHRDTVMADKDLILYFDFEGQQPWDRRLRSERPGLPEAAIIGARWTQGRWPGKGALEFKRITDRVRLHIPGEYDQLTLSAWVRLEGMESWYSSLLLTDGWDPGEVHWQISNQGEFILGVHSGANAISKPALGPEDLGRWLHIAAVVDVPSRRVEQYLDGKLVDGRVLGQKTGKLRFGNVEIGNWVSQGLGHAIRSLNGRMDEIAIWGRAMTQGEIQALEKAGRPNG